MDPWINEIDDQLDERFAFDFVSGISPGLRNEATRVYCPRGSGPLDDFEQ